MATLRPSWQDDEILSMDMSRSTKWLGLWASEGILAWVSWEGGLWAMCIIYLGDNNSKVLSHALGGLQHL
jgi:hypothetical protein